MCCCCEFVNQLTIIMICLDLDMEQPDPGPLPPVLVHHPPPLNMQRLMFLSGSILVIESTKGLWKQYPLPINLKMQSRSESARTLHAI